MILSKNNRVPSPVRNGEPSGIEEIVRRLDQLVQAVSNVTGQVHPPAINDSILAAAQRAWKARRERQRIFGPSIVADPAWDILLDLFMARIENREVNIASISAAIGIPQPTVLRWLAQLVEQRLVSSVADGNETANRRLSLTDDGVRLMCDYFIQTSPGLDVAAA